MGLVTEDAVRSLASFKGKEAPVVSVYLDVDGHRLPRRREYEGALDRLLRSARMRNDGRVAQDLDRIEAFVRAGIDRSHTRGLAIFACGAHGLWQVLHLGVPVRNQLVVNHTPHVRQLEALVQHYERFGVLVADRQRARMFVFEQRDLIDRSELFEALPRHEDDRGEWDRDHVKDHAATAAHAHLRRAAQVAFAVFQERAFDHLIISAPVEMVAELESELHSYLRERVAARLNLSANAGLAEIQSAAEEVEARIETTKQAALVKRLRDRIGASNGAVAGLEPVCEALGSKRVETLLVSEGYVEPGWRCWTCDQVAVRGPTCPTCGGTMVKVDDVIEEAVEVALGQACRVVTCAGDPDLDVAGRIGALLRF